MGDTVRRETGQFLSADGKSKIHVAKWLPEKEPVAVLQMVHGMQEYIERYEPFARYLAGQGFAVIGHDHIGHGASVPDESRWGIMEGKHPSDIMVEDMYRNYCLIREEYPGLPHFILGHSMGSYMLRKMIAVKAQDLADCSGAIIMGTGSESNLKIFMGKIILHVIAAFHSWGYRSPFASGLMFGAPYKDFDVTGKEPERSWLTKDIEIVKGYRDDPACSFMFSLSGFKALLEATSFDNSAKNIAKVPKDLSVIFVSGDRDPVGNLGKGVKTAYEKFAAAGMRDVTMKLYPGDRHEILNELDRQQVYEDLYQWMRERM